MTPVSLQQCFVYYTSVLTKRPLYWLALPSLNFLVPLLFLNVVRHLIYDHTKIWVSTIDSLIAVKQRVNFVASLYKRFAKRSKKSHPK